MKQLLSGHTSPDTAYVVDDYPYGFRLRCKIRYWIETSEKKGQRIMTQTSNPKKDGLVWNKPKASTYNDLRVMYIDQSTGHVITSAQLNVGYGAEKIEEFLAEYGPALTSAYELKTIRGARYVLLTRKHMDRLAGGNLYDVPEASRRGEIVAEAKAEALKELNREHPTNG